MIKFIKRKDLIDEIILREGKDSPVITLEKIRVAAEELDNLDEEPILTADDFVDLIGKKDRWLKKQIKDWRK